ncbi:30S ribosomal protein S20 [Candidatus Parcubacteria bacterium]|nr:30S ribosomal protein S20 [Candidatus Parcubacteria bacterium]
MPITRGAKKAHRSSLKKREFNADRKTEVSKAVKNLKKLVAAGDKKGAQALMPTVQKALDKAAKSHTIDKNVASRRKSRLSKLVKKLA